MSQLPRELAYRVLQFSGHVCERRDAATQSGRLSAFHWQLRRQFDFQSHISCTTPLMLTNILLVMARYSWRDFMFACEPKSRLWSHVCTVLLRHGPARDGSQVELVYQRYAFAPHCGIMYYRSDVHPIMVRTVTLLHNVDVEDNMVRDALHQDYALMLPPTSRQLELLEKFRQRALERMGAHN
jgi:hypothetical protein